MKPLEPGCLAVIVPPAYDENIGKTVKVLRRIGRMKGYGSNYGDWWELDTNLVLKNKIFINRKVFMCIHHEPYAPEQCLMRIDGHDEDEDDNFETFTKKNAGETA